MLSPQRINNLIFSILGLDMNARPHCRKLPAFLPLKTRNSWIVLIRGEAGPVQVVTLNPPVLKCTDVNLSRYPLVFH